MWLAQLLHSNGALSLILHALPEVDGSVVMVDFVVSLHLFYQYDFPDRSQRQLKTELN